MTDYAETVLAELDRLGVAQTQIEIRRDVNEYGLTLLFVEEALPGIAVEVAVGRSGGAYLVIDTMLQLETDLSSRAGADRFFLTLSLAIVYGISLHRRRTNYWVLVGPPDALPEEERKRLARLDHVRTWPPSLSSAVRSETALLYRGLPQQDDLQL